MNSNVSIPAHQTSTLDVVEGNLSLGKHATVKGMGKPSSLKVSGTIYCEGDNIFECNLSARSLEADGDVTVYGNLTVVELKMDG